MELDLHTQAILDLHHRLVICILVCIWTSTLVFTRIGWMQDKISSATNVRISFHNQDTGKAIRSRIMRISFHNHEDTKSTACTKHKHCSRGTRHTALSAASKGSITCRKPQTLRSVFALKHDPMPLFSMQADGMRNSK